MRKFTAFALVLVMLCALTVVAFANPSPTQVPEFIVDYTTYEHGYAENSITIVPEGDTWTVTVDESQYKFSGFTIKGKYELIEGSLDGPTILIRPLEDLVIIANFVGVKPKPGSDDSPISPPTGDSTLILVGLVVLFTAAGGAVFATKRLVRKGN